MFSRIDVLLTENGCNDADLAKIAGVGKSTVSGWRSGKYNPKKDKLQKIADHFNVSVEWLTGLDDYRTKDKQDTMNSLFSVHNKFTKEHKIGKQLELYQVSGGGGRINGDYPSETYDEIDYESGEYVDAVVSGDSMYPLIMDGDVITIHLDSTSKPDPKKISVVKIDGESTTVKYCEIVSDGIWIRAANKEVFPDTFYDISQIMSLPVKIIGTVVAVRRRL